MPREEEKGRTRETFSTRQIENRRMYVTRGHRISTLEMSFPYSVMKVARNMNSAFSKDEKSLLFRLNNFIVYVILTAIVNTNFRSNFVPGLSQF